MVGTQIKNTLHKYGILIRRGCQRLELINYMDRLGAQGCKERFNDLVDSLLADVKNWRYRDNSEVRIPERRIIARFLTWAIDEADDS